MPWQEASTMSLRREFVMLAKAEGANRAALCRRFGVSRKTGYKWLERSVNGAALGDQSRRPCASPNRSVPRSSGGSCGTCPSRPSSRC